jgi:hypothetical protein
MSTWKTQFWITTADLRAYLHSERRWIRRGVQVLARGTGVVVVRFRVRWIWMLLGRRAAVETRIRAAVRDLVPVGVEVEFWTRGWREEVRSWLA